MRSTGQHFQRELESIVSMAETVLGGSTVVKTWVTTPEAQWENRSPLRVVLDGESQRIIDFLSAKRIVNEGE